MDRDTAAVGSANLDGLSSERNSESVLVIGSAHFRRAFDAMFEADLAPENVQRMTPEVLAAAREPFFSTKDPGRGMGLGLTFVHSVAEQHGGRLDLTSEAGVGTTAVLRWPVEVS